MLLRHRTTKWSLIALGPLLACLASCGGGGGGGGSSTNPPDNDFDRRALLSSYTDRVVLPALRDFAREAADLEQAANALQEALAASQPADTEIGVARAAWRSAIDAWQTLEILQVGPAGSPTMVMGGLGLRDEIYSWPTVNACRVDQETVSGDFASADFFTRELVNTRGLDAIEYLLFDADTNNACSASVDINTSGSWNALVGTGGLPLQRARYAARASAEVTRRAVQLRDAWEPTLGNFAGQLTNAGLSGSQYSSAQDAVNDVFAALFYLELQVKDHKLALPAGLDPTCASDTCPELRESLWAHVSKEHIRANLVAAQRVFLGGDTSGIGFDDFLRALGASALADRMATNLVAAIAAVDAIPGSFEDALASNPQSVRDAYIALKAFTDDLKSQFVTVLNLEVPREGAGDND